MGQRHGRYESNILVHFITSRRAGMTIDWGLTPLTRNSPRARNRYRKFVEDLLDKEYDSPLKHVIASTILGRPEFVSEMSEQKLGETPDARNVPTVKELAIHFSMDDIIARVQEEQEPGDEKQQRNISIYCCQQFSGAKLRIIGARFGISDPAVT